MGRYTPIMNAPEWRLSSRGTPIAKTQGFEIEISRFGMRALGFTLPTWR